MNNKISSIENIDSCFVMLNPFSQNMVDSKDRSMDCEYCNQEGRVRISWHEIISTFGFENYRDVISAISSNGMFELSETQQSILYKIEAIPNLLLPIEGNISCHLLEDIKWLAESFGEQSINLLLPDGHKELPIDGLRTWWKTFDIPFRNSKVMFVPGMSKFSSQSNKWIIKPSFEGKYSYLFSDKISLSNFVSARNIEGFWTNVDTDIYDFYINDSVPSLDRYVWRKANT